jgi:hypothetical protein
VQPLFLNVYDDFRFPQLFGETLVFPLQLLIFRRTRIMPRFRPSLLWRQSFPDSSLPLAAPLCQMGRIESLAAQQGADLAGPPGRIRPGQYPPFILRSEPAPFGASAPPPDSGAAPRALPQYHPVPNLKFPSLVWLAGQNRFSLPC